MCCGSGKSLIKWLHYEQKKMDDLNYVLSVITESELSIFSAEKVDYRILYDLLKEKGLEQYKHTIKLLRRKYYIVPILTQDQEDKVIQIFDELAKKSSINMCAHYSFILSKCLELIGEPILSQEFIKLVPTRSTMKIQSNELRWIRFCNT